LEGVIFDGHDVRDRIVRSLECLLHREQSFPGSMAV
jgi:hypothetical protein